MQFGSMKRGYVYILSNKHRNVLYIGTTNNLRRRIAEHRSGKGSDFVSMYNVFDLVYFEVHPTMPHAIRREKQLKNWKRAYKDELIKSVNPDLRDLTEDLLLVDSDDLIL